jgi:bile acid-coenzyme A ligase
MVSEQPSVTWSELDSSTNRLARAYAELGVREGDFVAIGLPTSQAFVESMMASRSARRGPSRLCREVCRGFDRIFR